MADFCNICCAIMFDDSEEAKNNVGNILINYRFLLGGDINIENIFKEHIKPNIDNFLENELYSVSVGGVCEHCGLMRLSLKKENEILYLIAWCLKKSKENNTGKYKIAIVNNDKLEYQEEEIKKYFNE